MRMIRKTSRKKKNVIEPKKMSGICISELEREGISGRTNIINKKAKGIIQQHQESQS